MLAIKSPTDNTDRERHMSRTRLGVHRSAPCSRCMAVLQGEEEDDRQVILSLSPCYLTTCLYGSISSNGWTPSLQVRVVTTIVLKHGILQYPPARPQQPGPVNKYRKKRPESSLRVCVY